MCAWQSGGGSAPPTELAYADSVARQVIPNAFETAITGLSITLTVPVNSKFCLELYTGEVSEDSGSTAGDLVGVIIEDELSHHYIEAHVYQTAGGVGSALYMRSGTIVSDGSAHTYAAFVTNQTSAANGAIIGLGTGIPSYIRAVQL